MKRFWHEWATDADDDVSLAEFIAAAATLVLMLLAVFTWTLFFWSAVPA